MLMSYWTKLENIIIMASPSSRRENHDDGVSVTQMRVDHLGMTVRWLYLTYKKTVLE
jgi:hypothetical protein